MSMKGATSFDLFRSPYQDADEESCRRRAFTPAASSRYCSEQQALGPEKSYKSIRDHQKASRICFGDAVTTVANSDFRPKRSFNGRQRGICSNAEDAKDHPRRHLSEAKARELVGSNIFGKAPPKTRGRSTTPEGKRHLIQKYVEMNGNEIFKEVPPEDCPVERPGFISDAKLKEMEGHDVFADGKAYYRGRAKPPDGEAQINGTNPALPDIEASEYLMAHPKKMSERHTSNTKIKEIVGNYDIFHGQDCLDFGKHPLGFPPAKPQRRIRPSEYL